MSWDAYCTSLTATGNVSKAGIYGLDGNPWAQSSGLTLSQAEASVVIAALKDKSKVLEGGVKLQGQKYFYLREAEDGKGFYFKKGTSGGLIAGMNTSVIIGLYVEGQQPGACNVQVQKIADYLRNAGY